MTEESAAPANKALGPYSSLVGSPERLEQVRSGYQLTETAWQPVAKLYLPIHIQT